MFHFPIARGKCGYTDNNAADILGGEGGRTRRGGSWQAPKEGPVAIDWFLPTCQLQQLLQQQLPPPRLAAVAESRICPDFKLKPCLPLAPPLITSHCSLRRAKATKASDGKVWQSAPQSPAHGVLGLEILEKQSSRRGVRVAHLCGVDGRGSLKAEGEREGKMEGVRV